MQRADRGWDPEKIDKARVDVQRAVAALSRKHHLDGRRFFVKEYPKDREWRQFRLSDQIARKLSAHAAAHDLGPDDLLFGRRGDLAPRRLAGRAPGPGHPRLD